VVEKQTRNDDLAPARGIANGILLSLPFWLGLALLFFFFFLSSCVSIRGPKTGYQKTTEEPLHAESGVGATIWKIPVLGIGFWGQDGWWGGGVPSVIIHKDDYQAQPPGLAYGTPPSPPTAGPPAVDYKTMYESAWDDPTLVVFVNQSYRVIRLQIGDEPEIRLEPYQATVNLHLAPGEYNIRKTVEKPTRLKVDGKNANAVFDWLTFLKIYVRLDGRSQIIYLYDY